MCSEVSVVILLGIWVKRLDDRLRECRLLVSGVKLVVGMLVKELFVRFKCLRKCYLEVGRMFMERRLEVFLWLLCYEFERFD